MTATPSTLSQPSSGKVDVFVAGAGTGGTVTGISRALKKGHNPECIVIGIDPVGTCGHYAIFHAMTLSTERKYPRVS